MVEWPVVKNKLMTWHYKMPQIFTLLAIYIALHSVRFCETQQKFMCWFNLQLCITRRLLMNSYHLFDDSRSVTMFLCLYPICRWMELLSFYCYLVLSVPSFYLSLKLSTLSITIQFMRSYSYTRLLYVWRPEKK